MRYTSRVPLSPRFIRLADSVRTDLDRLHTGLAELANPHDEIEFDHDLGVVMFRHHGRDVWQGYAHLVGRLHIASSSFEWFGESSAAVPVNVRGGVPELGEMVLRPIEENEASLLADVVGHFRRACGVLRRQEGPFVSFYALSAMTAAERASLAPRMMSSAPAPLTLEPRRPTPTDGRDVVVDVVGEARYSTSYPKPSAAPAAIDEVYLSPPPPMAQSTDGADSHATVRSIAPPPVSPASSPPTKPPREKVTPLAQMALGVVANMLPGGFGQVLLTITIDPGIEKSRFALHLVATDRRGDIVAIDTPKRMLDTAYDLLREDCRRENGQWRKLVLRIRPHPTKLLMGIEVR